jgi:ATP-dependent DNA helicase RecQ
MSLSPRDILLKYWGFDSFRPMQEEIIASVLGGTDTLALLPTGGGKSVCFQVPALCLPGLCVVVTPLVALMTDQVENLKHKGIMAVAMHAGMHTRELAMGFDKCAGGKAKFLYLSPERLETRKFREQLRSLNVSLIAVDEAHCISQWGYDFRPPYLRIAAIRDIFPQLPLLALTATAVPKVVGDIMEKLQFRQGKVFSRSFVRNNLSWVVSREDDKFRKLLRICNGVQGCGIVYVRNRRLTGETAELLNHHGISAASYHAGLEPSLRLKRQHDWMAGRTRIIVATNAFGMGIDKPDVRLVVHLDLTDSLEAYYQEAGRAGRDGKRSYAVLLFNEHDLVNSRHHLSLAWPGVETVRQVYQALGNFLQVPVGSGAFVSFPFDLEKFCNTYKLKPVTAFSALKILERDGYVLLSDSWDEPSRILITCSKEDLYRYQVEHDEADKVLRVILRSYGGVFTDFVRISENEIARRSGIDSPKVEQLIAKMQKQGVLEYIPRRTEPQLVFTAPRADAKDIGLSEEFYSFRKKEAALMLEQVIRYAESGTECRSRMLVSYFGEQNAADCGTCDVCLSRKRREMSGKKFAEAAEAVKQQLSVAPKSVSELISGLSRFRESDLISVVRWLIEEGEVISDGDQLHL